MAAKSGPDGQAGPAQADAAPAGPAAGPAETATGAAPAATGPPGTTTGPPGTASGPARPAAGTAGPPAGGTAPAQATIPRVRAGRAIAVATAALVAAVAVGVSLGPADLSLPAVGEALLSRLPWHPGMSVSAVAVTIVWQVRLPRVVLGALVGAMLAGGGAAYQGVFRNPLADPYLLGVAAGGGLGATMIIITGGSQALLPPAAFLGAGLAVAVTYLLGTTGRNRSATGGATASIVLAGVAVAALFTAVQTYLQQEHTQVIQQIYAWILGSLATASWSDVAIILPYAVAAAALLLAHRRLLDVLRVGEVEATSLGVDIARLRLTVVVAATLGTAAAVAVSGLIGFVGIIIPHTVRLTAGASYRIVLPVSMIGGAAFLVLADVAARTVQAPSEVPIGVITALAGAPFFLFVLRSRRARRDLA
jgi:iron complex transport system permease protein